jgi:iron complex transport system ATP-binding protein
VAVREQLLETIDGLTAIDPALASIVVTHHLEELPATTTPALLLREGQVVASGPARETITTPSVSSAFDHPICVRLEESRWLARAARIPLRV